MAQPHPTGTTFTSSNSDTTSRVHIFLYSLPEFIVLRLVRVMGWATEAGFTFRLATDRTATAHQIFRIILTATFSIDNLNLIGFDDTTSIVGSAYGSNTINQFEDLLGGETHTRTLSGGSILRSVTPSDVSISVSMNSGTM